VKVLGIPGCFAHCPDPRDLFTAIVIASPNVINRGSVGFDLYEPVFQISQKLADLIRILDG
jgi:hypothetical protein